jgi:hypothetical protein
MDGAEVQASALSAPAYPYRHSGAVLVCGFGPTFWEDLERARKLRPGAPIIACNNAASAVKALAIFSQHSTKLGGWAKAQRKFGDDFTVHAPGSIDLLDQHRRRHPYVDYWWPLARGTGTSPWAAQKLGKMMGFEERILVGVPLERGPYADGTFARDFRRKPILKIYRDFIRCDTAWHEGVKAMSGWTMRMFGEPDGHLG